MNPDPYAELPIRTPTPELRELSRKVGQYND
jgi:hypothetical protein